jgi:5-methylcytosine-specific restriction enzyme subunit McrC
MLRISEHFEFYDRDHLSTLKKVSNWEHYYVNSIQEDRIDFLSNKDHNCVTVSLLKQNEDQFYTCKIQSSYYIGLDQFSKLKLNVYVEPKLNNGTLQLDYISMLLEALKAPENFDHLDGLIETKLNEEWIEIKSDLKPILTPFLIAQFLAVVQNLVKKGLKKSYYTVQENLNSRVKGKILVGDQIKHNLLKNRLTKTICQYQEFGFDTEVNQFLKHVLSVIPNLLADFSQDKQFKQLQEVLNYCKGGFYQVNNKVFKKLKYHENNPFYRNYNQAIQLGNQILSLQDYNISSQNQQQTTKHPRFWIDMSKLFELYVFQQLKEKYPKNGEVQYHKKFNKQEPDFILNIKDGIKAVVDAKYKPRYANGNPSMEDARQLSGYTRLNSVYRELGITDNTIIPAYFIYPTNLSLIDEEDSNCGDIFEDDVIRSDTAILKTDCRKSTSYKEMYLQEVKLPFLVAVSKEKVISAN